MKIVNIVMIAIGLMAAGSAFAGGGTVGPAAGPAYSNTTRSAQVDSWKAPQGTEAWISTGSMTGYGKSNSDARNAAMAKCRAMIKVAASLESTAAPFDHICINARAKPSQADVIH